MINVRSALAAAALAVGAGAVTFLSTNSPHAVDSVHGGGPVPVQLPPIVAQLPAAPAPVVPAVAPPSSSARPAATPPRRKSAGRAAPPATKAQAVPRRLAAPVPATTQQQPRPSGVEPNGSGGWQLPACYEDSCTASPRAATADPCTGTGTQCLDATLGQLGITNPIPALMGGR